MTARPYAVLYGWTDKANLGDYHASYSTPERAVAAVQRRLGNRDGRTHYNDFAPNMALISGPEFSRFYYFHRHRAMDTTGTVTADARPPEPPPPTDPSTPPDPHRGRVPRRPGGRHTDRPPT
jgi:hypothetical protein